MTFDKFTIKAQGVVQQAVALASANSIQAIEPSVILCALLDKAKDVCTFLFQKLGVNAQQVELLATQEMKHLPKVEGGEPYLTSDSNRMLQASEDWAKKMGDGYVSAEAMLLALLATSSSASRILKDAGCSENEMLQAVKELRNGQNVQSQSADDNYQSLAKYAKNLVEQARAGKLDPVIGRDDEIRRVLQILSRRTAKTAGAERPYRAEGIRGHDV